MAAIDSSMSALSLSTQVLLTEEVWPTIGRPRQPLPPGFIPNFAFQGFRVFIKDFLLGPYFRDPEFKDKEKDGVGVFVLPTQSDYKIDVINTDVDSWFAIEEATIGERKITINNGKRIMYPRSAEITGFETGTTKSFKFVSLSKAERESSEAAEAKEAMKTYGESNVITLVLQRYKRIPAPVIKDMRFGAPRSYGASFGESFGASFGASFGESYGASRELSGLQTCSASLGASTGHAHDLFGKLDGAAATEFAFGAIDSAPATKGATVSGGSSVSHVQTSTTKATFDKAGEPVRILIQLTCRESDEQKAVNNSRARLHHQGLDYCISQMKALNVLIQRHKAELEEMNKRLGIHQRLLADIVLDDTDFKAMPAGWKHQVLTQNVLIYDEHKEPAVLAFKRARMQAEKQDSQLVQMQE